MQTIVRALVMYQLKGVDMPCCMATIKIHIHVFDAKSDQHIDDVSVFQVIFNMWSK